MDSYFLIGAIIGSGAFILLGREPARRLVEGVRSMIRR